MYIIFIRGIHMNLMSGTYYWPATFPDPPSYPQLEGDLECDVLIVGGGSSASQCAYYLADSDLNVAVIEKGKVGGGSTSSNTALIQYSGEKMFTSLANSFGKKYITRHLALLQEAINEIESAAAATEIDCEFCRRDSLYSASCSEDVATLRKEYEFLKEQGLNVDFLSKEEIEQKYPFSRDAAIYSNGDGELNPFRFTHALIDYAAQKGIQVYENTEMNGHHYDPKTNRMIVSTKNGHSISAGKVIFAAGYEGIDLKKEKLVSFVSTYTVTSKPVSDLSSWHNRTLLWETARPYIYLRTTADKRIIVGGLDDNTNKPADRDSKLVHKRDTLVNEFHKMFPAIKLEPEDYLAAFYGGTADGLPIIGVYDEYPNSYFLLAFGDNGTVYSQMLAKIIAEDIVKGSSPDLELYLQNRPHAGKN